MIMFSKTRFSPTDLLETKKLINQIDLLKMYLPIEGHLDYLLLFVHQIIVLDHLTNQFFSVYSPSYVSSSN